MCLSLHRPPGDRTSGRNKNAGPDLPTRRTWRLADVEERLGQLTLRARVGHGGEETRIQDGTPAELLTPAHWAGVLRERGDTATGDTISLSYDVLPVPAPIG